MIKANLRKIRGSPKIVTLKKLQVYLKNLKKQGRQIVLVTGCFDILHSAHKKFLQKAKSQGDVLLVGLEQDERVRRLKGKGRPINSWPKRAKNLARLRLVDFIFPLPKNLEERKTQEALVKQIKPDILALSSHTPYLGRKREVIEKFGGKLKIVLPHYPKISTTKILENSI